jgi:hypothetical protein
MILMRVADAGPVLNLVCVDVPSTFYSKRRFRLFFVASFLSFLFNR